ncbi:unnamed protein product [Adineta steineri]|uniref:Uncharacterized protein n=1 Tax=Adineta steineri TaxID=433720 RepID=A0A819W1N9_9BILA|nr:unnamed protein product [Adineta steineri]CAF4116805.1 unnamed protein product [Adineta steineri]
MGIINQSPRNDFVSCHSTAALLTDLKNDFIGGICPIALLKQASLMRLITYVRIQQRMENSQYGNMHICNRPPLIRVKHLQNYRIATTATQKLC